MTPEELSEALQIARETTEEMVYSRRVLARAVIWLRETLQRANLMDEEDEEILRKSRGKSG